MNLNQLKAFHVVAKTKSFSKAAEELFVTEPAVFVQVKSLERSLGFKLLDRFRKDLEPTEAGRMLFEYAEKIFALVDDADLAMKELQTLRSGDFRIGSSRSLAQYLMPPVVTAFHDYSPAMKVFLSEGSSRELIEAVLNHQIELAVVARMPYPDRISATPFGWDQVLVVVSPYSELSRKKEVALEELYNQPLISWNDGSATRLAVFRIFEKQGLKPSAIIETENPELIKDMVKKGKGYVFLASICVRKEIEQGELATVTFRGGNIGLSINVIHLKGKTLSPAAETFLRFLFADLSKHLKAAKPTQHRVSCPLSTHRSGICNNRTMVLPSG